MVSDKVYANGSARVTMQKGLRTPTSASKRRTMQTAWSKLAYLWFYLLRRGPQAVRRRLQVLKYRQKVLKEAHVESG
jgi:hypothetical protein